MYPARFSHHSLDAFGVILEALRLGDAIARELPRGYGKLTDPLRRALLGAYLQFTEAAAREGPDRNSRPSSSIASAPWSLGSEDSARAEPALAAARSMARGRDRRVGHVPTELARVARRGRGESASATPPELSTVSR